MLRIEQVKSYRLPRYPQGSYYERPQARVCRITSGVASTAMLAFLLSSCEPEPVGVVGPPPMPPDMVTEMEARSVINEVFTRNRINLEADVPFSVSLSDQNPISLDLDGFNKDINIGYEYVSDGDYASFTEEVLAELDKVGQSTGGPYIKTVTAQYASVEANENLESIIQDFIADLLSRGVIQ